MSSVQGPDVSSTAAPPLPVEVRTLLELLGTEAARADGEGDAAAARDLRRGAVALASRNGAVTGSVPSQPRPESGAPGSATCFGTFQLHVAGQRLGLGELRPRARTMLRLLALHAGRPVHREVLLAALWPDSDPVSAGRSMLTTLSSLRALLAGTAAGGALRRDGHAYLLAPELLPTDVAEAEQVLRDARWSGRRNPLQTEQHLERALVLYTGDLLPEEGPAEWVVEPREQWRGRIAAAAHELAVLRYAAGRTAGAVRAARQGLAVDRLSDPLWRVLVAALRHDEDPAAADAAAAAYDSVLAGL